MEKIERTNAPGWLNKNWKKWGADWATRYGTTQKSSSFQWRQFKKKGRKDLVRELAAMTRDHCSFCDAYPMGSRIPYTIEHFRPKTKFPQEAYKWENLFLCCGLCQEKGEEFDECLLKPDEDYYSFEKYFEIDWPTGELIPNVDASEEDQERARITIRLYRLNNNGKPEDRLEELEQFEQMNSPDIDKFPYRFFIKRGQGQI
jgi:uncharacterized protein (TIGR02646 family)